MTTTSSNLAWEIPWTEETGRLQSTELQRMGQDWATKTFIGKICYEKSMRLTSEGYGNNYFNDLYAFPNFYLMNLHCLQKENQENLHWLDCCSSVIFPNPYDCSCFFVPHEWSVLLFSHYGYWYTSLLECNLHEDREHVSFNVKSSTAFYQVPYT